jgi:hypothetical protein
MQVFYSAREITNRYIGSSTETKPTNESGGVQFYEYDTGQTYVWNGTAWVIRPILPLPTVTRFTGSSAIVATVNPARNYHLDNVAVHLSTIGGSGTLTIYKDSGTSSAYDVVYYTADMTAVKDIYWQPERPIPMFSGDIVTVTYANASTCTFGVEVEYQ